MQEAKWPSREEEFWVVVQALPHRLRDVRQAKLSACFSTNGVEEMFPSILRPSGEDGGVLSLPSTLASDAALSREAKSSRLNSKGQESMQF